MRTTIDFDPPLLERAKRRAAKRGQTLSHLVRDAVSTYLAETSAMSEEPFEIVTCGEVGGYCPTPREMAAADDVDDARWASGRSRADT